ncbi:MAG: ribosome maturation factor RimP [Deltaproteobacteria bacterium]|nr:ribosome maturation factor RimP [Deltaproteobacteria bacterium]
MTGPSGPFLFFMQASELQKIESIIEPVAQSIQCELVACEWVSEFGKNILRVFIDKPTGVQIADCEKLTYLLDPLLDVEDVISARYNLEVSSPGLDRPLKKLSDFERFKGQRATFKTSEPIENRSNYSGILHGVENNQVLIEIDQRLYKIDHSKIAKAQLKVDWEQALKKHPKKKL